MERLPFFIGSATSSFQVEGSSNNRGRSIWDEFCEKKDAIVDGSSATVACDHFNKFKEDIELMRSLGLKEYRFSVSWPRIMPDGKNVSDDGVAFYKTLIEALVEAGIEPYMTLFHWDLPLEIEKEFGGWRSNKIVALFGDFARVCFRAFSDKVRHFFTLNEAWVFAKLGYQWGRFAPGVRDEQAPIEVVHNMLLAHATAVQIFRKDFARTGSTISMTIFCNWFEPMSSDDQKAAENALIFQIGWIADPIFLGDYPLELKELLEGKLPSFTDDERQMLKGSCDTFALNHYNTQIVQSSEKDNQSLRENVKRIYSDQGLTYFTDSTWNRACDFPVLPWAFKKVLDWVSKRYSPQRVLIAEFGFAEATETVENDGHVHDVSRVQFLEDYISVALEAKKEGIPILGMFLWSFMDNFEWFLGYTRRYGIVHVDRVTLKRTIKDSGFWLQRAIGSKIKNK